MKEFKACKGKYNGHLNAKNVGIIMMMMISYDFKHCIQKGILIIPLVHSIFIGRVIWSHVDYLFQCFC